jgi:hypothetical protein
MSGMGRIFIIAGIILVACGVLISFAPRLPSWFGRLPGDIAFRRGNFGFYMPLATCLLISAILSLIMWLFRK